MLMILKRVRIAPVTDEKSAFSIKTGNTGSNAMIWSADGAAGVLPRARMAGGARRGGAGARGGARARARRGGAAELLRARARWARAGAARHLARLGGAGGARARS